MKKTILLFTIILNTLLFAQNADYEINIKGNLKKDVPTTTTPKKLNELLKSKKFNVYNPWEKKADDYEGIFVSDVVKYFGTKDAKNIKFIALDNYETKITKELWKSERILLVTKVNDKFLSFRSKGPMRIVFVDYDPKEEKYKSTLNSWMWMITNIEIE